MTKSALLSSNAVAMVYISIILLKRVSMISSEWVSFQTWGEVVLGSVARVLPVLIALSALGSANGLTYTSARYCMVSARYGYLPEIFSYIQKQRLTPLPGIIFQVCLFVVWIRFISSFVFKTILAIIYCIPSDIEGLINYFSFVSWLFCGLTFVATLCCKFTKRDVPRLIKVYFVQFYPKKK